jgi:hypothetical protein
LKKTYLYANSTTQRYPKEIIKNFRIEDLFHLPLVANLELPISPRIFEKIRNGPTDIITGLGETDLWTNQKQRISWHWPFNFNRILL